MKNVTRLAVMILVAAYCGVCASAPAAAQENNRHEMVSIAAGLSHKDLNVRRKAAEYAMQSPDISQLDALVRALSDTDQVVRQRAATALRSIPQERADQAVIAALDNQDAAVRRELVQRFQRHTSQAAKAIESRLEDSDLQVRQHAAKILSENPHADATAILRRSLEHYDRTVRSYATARLSSVAVTEALPLLLARLNDSEREVRVRAIQTLRTLPDGAGDQAILAAFKHSDFAVRQQAVAHFRDVANQQRIPDLVDALAAALADTENAVRQHAVAALCVSTDERATSVILGALRHPDPEVRRQAAQSLQQKPQPKYIDPLIAALNDLDRGVRTAAAHALNLIDDPRGKAAAKTALDQDVNFDRNKLIADSKTPSHLSALLMHRDNDVRRLAAEALRRLDGDEATQAALSAMDNPDPIVRGHLAARFRERRTPAALSRLVQALNDSDQTVRREAALSLRYVEGDEADKATLAGFDHADEDVRVHLIARFIDKPQANVLPALLKVVATSDPRSSQTATQAIRRMDGDDAAQALLRLFDHLNVEVRVTAVGRFQEKPDARVVANLVRALDDSDTRVRSQAAVALRVTPGDEATQAALAAFDHPDEQVRLQAVHRFIDRPDARATPRLIEMLDDENHQVRQFATQALGNSATEKYVAQLVALLYHSNRSLRSLIAGKLRPLILDANRFANSPLTAVHTIDRLKSFPAIAIDTPSSYVEMIGGDRIVGTVVGYVPRAAANEGVGGHLLVKPQKFLVTPDEPTERKTVEHARVRTQWIRRVVWQPQKVLHYTPGVIFLRRGSQIGFDSLRWETDGIAIMLGKRIERIAYNKIAELHLPNRDPWAAYCEQLAVLACKPADKLLRLDYSDGSHLTSSADRFVPFSNVDSADPNDWQHTVHPAWCMDGLASPQRSMALRSWLPLTEVPLCLPLGARSSAAHWPWRVNRNIQGGQLQSGSHQFRWGFGVHADSVLRFNLPRYATGFRTEVGLDQIVRDRGCARPIVRLRMGENVRDLYRGSLMIGSETVQDTSTMPFSSVGDAAQLELVADSAGREHPAGGDPLNIRDMVDWLEPRLLLDAEGLSAAIEVAATQLDSKLLERDRVFDSRLPKSQP